jgi:exosortase
MLKQDSQSASPSAALATETSTMRGSDPTSPAFSCWMTWAIVLLPLGYLWFRLIDNLSVEWNTNPQYSYGWVVPLLCLGLLLRRWQSFPELRNQKSVINSQRSVILLFAFFAFLYLPTRLIEEATPEWRPIQWSLGTEAIGLTLCLIYLGKGQGWLRQVAFPICFFFVAIPWPTLIEQPVIQSLTRINSAIVVELLGWMGIPALQHGNLIELSTGTVGVEEACSGIRSFQTSLMISLFFGEFYAMGWGRRLLLVPLGFILAMGFNVCRMWFLTMVAAKKGVAAIAEYHDPAGIMITLVCTAGLWGLARLFKSSKSLIPSGQIPTASGGPEVNMPHPRSSILLCLGAALLLWLVAVEVGTQLWYRGLESHLVPSPKWSVMLPADSPTFKTMPIDTKTEYLLQFDDAKQGAWIDSEGHRWQTFYCSWRPGRVAGYLAKRHTPEICLPATGWKMVSGPELTMMNVRGVALPVRSYVFGTESGSMYVFHCRWEAGVNEDAYVAHESARFNLIRGIWAGRGNHGQKVLEIIVSGYADIEQAKAALGRQLQTLIKVENPEEKIKETVLGTLGQHANHTH